MVDSWRKFNFFFLYFYHFLLRFNNQLDEHLCNIHVGLLFRVDCVIKILNANIRGMLNVHYKINNTQNWK